MSINERLRRIEFAMNPDWLGSFAWLAVKFIRFEMKVEKARGS
jgi:hypothetical protein